MPTQPAVRIFLSFFLCSAVCAQTLPRAEWGAPEVAVNPLANGQYAIVGKKNKVTVDSRTLAMSIQNGSANWKMVASGANDLQVKTGGKEFSVRLADAKDIHVEPYDTGFKTGVKIRLSKLPHAGGLTLYLTVCLEGRDEELVCDVAAEEGDAMIRQLDWPTALDAHDVDY